MAGTDRGQDSEGGVGIDVAILTVIPAELEAARLALGLEKLTREEKESSGTVYYRGTVRSELAGRQVGVVLTCIGAAGNPSAAVAAAAMIARYRPRAVLLMGIAAGIRGKVRIGDVVLSERVVAYEPAALVRSASGASVQGRPEIDRAPHAMLQDMMSYRADAKRLREAFLQVGGEFPGAPAGKEEEFREHVAGSIAARLGTIASGEKLLRDPAKLVAVRDSMHGKVEVGEMEAAGLVEACRPGNVPWLVIRGISDFGDELKDDRFHGFAARATAAVLVDFVGYGLDLRETESVADERSPPPRPMSPPTRNLGETESTGDDTRKPGARKAWVSVFNRSNPFVFGRPIDRDEDFFGRQQEKKWIREAIDKGQPVQLLGESRMGKSSLLRWVQRNVLPGRPVIEVEPLCELTPASMVLGIANKLDKAASATTLTRPEATSGEAAAVLNALVPFVLVMDDADALAERGRGFDVGFFAALRGLVQARKLTWVSASRGNLYELFEARGLSSAFLNDAQKFWVGPLDGEAAWELAGRGAIGEREVERVVAEASGLAYGLQWLGDYLHRRSADIGVACDAFKDEAEPIFRRWWGGLDVMDRQLLKGCLGGEVVVEGLESKSRRRLRRLVERGFLKEHQGHFAVEGNGWWEFVDDAE